MFFPLSVRAEDPEQAEGLLLLSLIIRMGLQSCMEKFPGGFAVASAALASVCCLKVTLGERKTTVAAFNPRS